MDYSADLVSGDSPISVVFATKITDSLSGDFCYSTHPSFIVDSLWEFWDGAVPLPKRLIDTHSLIHSDKFWKGTILINTYLSI